MLASATALSPTRWIWMWNSGTSGWEPQRRAIKELSWLLSALAVSANGKGFAQGQRKVEMERRVIPQRGRGAGFNTNRQPVSWLTQSTHGVKSVGSGLSQNADNAKLLMSWLGEVVMSDYMQVDQKVFCRRVTFFRKPPNNICLSHGKSDPWSKLGPQMGVAQILGPKNGTPNGKVDANLRNPQIMLSRSQWDILDQPPGAPPSPPAKTPRLDSKAPGAVGPVRQAHLLRQLRLARAAQNKYQASHHGGAGGCGGAGGGGQRADETDEEEAELG